MKTSPTNSHLPVTCVQWALLGLHSVPPQPPNRCAAFPSLCLSVLQSPGGLVKASSRSLPRGLINWSVSVGNAQASHVDSAVYCTAFPFSSLPLREGVTQYWVMKLLQWVKK